MANHIWTIVCRRSIVEKDTNILSIIDVAEQLSIDVHVSPEVQDADVIGSAAFHLISFWERTDPKRPEPETQIETRVISPSGKLLGKMEADFSMNDPHTRSRVTVSVPGMPVRESGRYEIRVFLKKGKRWQRVATVPLTIVVSVKRDLPGPEAVAASKPN